MKLYLMNAENIYFPQIKEYFQEIVSSYDNGNYRSAMVMLYSTVVCDLLLKLKELSDIYADTKAESILAKVNNERKKKGNSAWEWELIESIGKQTELLSVEAYTMIQHIYDLRNFSAHPAMNEDYELISPSQEMTVAYIKKALEEIFIKPSVFVDSIVDRISDDVASRKELFLNDLDGFALFLDKVYFRRMSSKMFVNVFKAFWKFTFKKSKEDGDVFEDNRLINRKTLEVMLDSRYRELCEYIRQNKSYFSISGNDTCMAHACVLLAYFPQVYKELDDTVTIQLQKFDKKDMYILKWFEAEDLESHLSSVRIRKDYIDSSLLTVLEKICKKQGQTMLFTKFLLDHFNRTASFSSARDRFDYMIEPYLDRFTKDDLIRLVEIINSNDQIYNYSGQYSRNNAIMAFANRLLPESFDFSGYEKFKYTKASDSEGEKETVEDNLIDTDPPF